MMIHNPYNPSGVVDDSLVQMKAMMLDIYNGKSNLSKDTLDDMMNRETWITADEALEMGFVDSILNDKRKKSTHVALQSLSKIENMAQLEEICNEYLQEIKINTDLMENQNENAENLDKAKVEDTLVEQESKESTEESTTDEKSEVSADEKAEEKETIAQPTIETTENTSDSIAEVEAFKNVLLEIENYKNQIDEIKAEYASKIENLQAEITTYKAEKKAMEIEQILNEAISKGKIKGDSKENWVKLAHLDMEQVKATLEKLSSIQTTTSLLDKIQAQGSEKSQF